MTLEDVADAMCGHEEVFAPRRRESDQWAAFSAAARRAYGVDPTDDAAANVEVDEDFAAYWRAVARREWDRAALYADVPGEWRE